MERRCNCIDSIYKDNGLNHRMKYILAVDEHVTQACLEKESEEEMIDLLNQLISQQDEYIQLLNCRFSTIDFYWNKLVNDNFKLRDVNIKMLVNHYDLKIVLVDKIVDLKLLAKSFTLDEKQLRSMYRKLKEDKKETYTGDYNKRVVEMVRKVVKACNYGISSSKGLIIVWADESYLTYKE